MFWLSLLAQLFHLTEQEAARSLNIGVTVLKTFKKKWNIKRWPSRTYNSILKLIQEVEASHADDCEAEKRLVLDSLK